MAGPQSGTLISVDYTRLPLNYNTKALRYVVGKGNCLIGSETVSIGILSSNEASNAHTQAEDGNVGAVVDLLHCTL